MKTNKYLKLLILMFTLLGCRDTFLDEEILGVETIDSFYTTETGATKAVNSLYGQLKNVGNRMAFGDIMSDDAWKGGENNADFQPWYDLLAFNIDPLNEAVTGMWVDSYNLIYEANVAIQKIPEIKMDETKRNRLVAEARGLRAFSYFELVRLFGDVPLIQKPLTPKELAIPRNDKNEVYGFIEKELLDISNILPETYAAEDHGRLTKYAAIGLLAKVYLFQGKFTEVEKYAKEVIDGNVYQLNSNFNDNFSLDNYAGNPEFIFEIKSHPLGGYAISSTVSLLAVMTGIRGDDDTGWGFDNPTQDLYDAYDDGDPRREFTIAKDGDFYDSEDILVLDPNVPAYGVDGDGYAGKKWYETKSKRSSFGDIDHYMQKSFPILRYADIILMYAEALNENGKASEALQQLNSIRERARNSTSPTSSIPADLSVSGQSEIRDAILKERRLELAFEWNRYYDLIRTKRASKVLKGFAAKYNTPKGAAFDDSKHYLMPIPQVDITRTDGVIKQNPGY